MPDINWEEIIVNYRRQIIYILVGLSLLGTGIIVYKTSELQESDKIEIVEDSQETQGLIIEVGGAVESPGVYKLSSGARVDDVIKIAGGFSEVADRQWVSKSINLAAKITDGQKIYIPSEGETLVLGSQTGQYQNISETSNGTLVSINSASQKDLESLSGIGPVYAQNIIDHRPYSNIDELINKDVIPKSTYNKIKDDITI